MSLRMSAVSEVKTKFSSGYRLDAIMEPETYVTSPHQPSGLRISLNNKKPAVLERNALP